MNKLSINILIFLIPVLSYGTPDSLKVAVIVNRMNPTNDVLYTDLVKILTQEKQYWTSGKKIYLIMQETGSPEKKIILREIFNMNDQELKKFWLTKMFRGKISSFPKTLSSNEAVKRFVSQVPSAIGYVNVSIIDESVKVLSIDGKLPKDSGYILIERIEYED